jgi:oxepin-CoA hydrolase/3-oxo-5,6-dehydrosuberyl-CoA semialdehyde dehydrogenase
MPTIQTERVLPSYVGGAWRTPTSEAVPLADAVTGATVTMICPAAGSAGGIDVGAALAYGRSIGGPALRAMTFHDRALVLKSLALQLNERREELYRLSYRTGATLYDSRFDIDGGIGTLFGFASKRRELPNDTVYVDGAVEQLGRGGTFVGQHIYTSPHGVAVQINAFNFPVWGPLEKFAPAFLAGVPSLIKPASPTAYLTQRLVEIVIESGLLPPGALQLVCGGIGNLFDQLTEQDMVSFTGSAFTAQRLRTHPAVAARSVRFNVEADSLNCSILGPDATPGTVEFDLYVKQLITEMTTKAGQKCTAIRRAFVPTPVIEDVLEAVRERLSRIVIGDPVDPAVRMGALASREQRAEVRRSLKALLAAGTLVYGDPEQVDVLGADAERGAFLSPLLVRCDDADRSEPHEVEAFGPVGTVLPYRDTDEVIALAARGWGSLVGSVVTGDTSFARDVVIGLAPWHGRLLVLDRDDAKESTGHGSPLPALIHGGPGRAGGGEELGGVRGVLHHMQRTAVQGSPRVLAALTGRWVTGAPRVEQDVHPFRKSLQQLRIGDSVTAGPRSVKQADIDHFADFTGDAFYVHTDAVAAAANPFFDGLVAHGYLVLSLAAGLFVDPAPGPVLANFGVDSCRFLAPTYPGDELTVTLTAKQITPRAGDYGEVRWDTVVTKQGGAIVATYDVLTMVAKQWPPLAPAPFSELIMGHSPRHADDTPNRAGNAP